jgi:hypothetical protein
MRPARLPEEFHLAVACCLWPPSDERNKEIWSAAANISDWNRFLRIATHHRVAGLVHDGLRRAHISVPQEISNKLRDQAMDLVRQNLQFASESVRLQTMLDDLGIPNLSVKGVTLAQLAYGALSVKQSWDIDLLVTPETVPRAIGILLQAGYRAHPPLPSESDPLYRHWIKYAHEYVFINDSKATPVELHWRLTDNEHFMAGVSAKSPTQNVTIAAGVGLRTLEDDNLFSFLCIHGAFHGWARLKWLADLAALVSSDSAEKLERRFETSKRGNAEHCVAQAFLLCDRLFGMPALSAISKNLRKRWRYRCLERMGFGIITMGNAEIKPGSGSFDMVPLYLSHFLLGHGWTYILSDLRNKLQMPYDLLYLESGTRPGTLYILKRVLNWLARRGRLRNSVIRDRSGSDS